MSVQRVLKHALTRLRSARAQADHDYCNVFLKEFREISELHSIKIPEAKVLVVGCGYAYPDVSLWSAMAGCAVGVDVRKAFLRSGPAALYADYRRGGNGFAKALARTMLIRWTYASYYDHLRRSSGLTLLEQNQDIVVYDSLRLPFADEAFDIVCSNAVLEHVSDIDTVSREMQRVTRPSGVGFHLWHNYYSLSGGHVPDDLALACPWGHLLGESAVDKWLKLSGTYLNKKLPDEMVRSLSNYYVELRTDKRDAKHRRGGVDPGYEPEGEELMTPEIERLLAFYPRDVLLTRAYSFIGMRK